MGTVKVKYDVSTMPELVNLGARFGVSPEGVLNSAPAAGLVLYDEVLAKHLSVESEPFEKRVGAKWKPFVQSFDPAEAYAIAARNYGIDKSTSHQQTDVLNILINDLDAEQAEQKGMRGARLARFGLLGLIDIGGIFQETPIIDKLYLVNARNWLRGELAISKQKNADRIKLKARHTSILGWAYLAIKTAE